MITKKPKVTIYEPSEKGATAMRKVSFRNTGPDRYVRLSDYEAECAKLRADNSELHTKLETLVDALEEIDEWVSRWCNEHHPVARFARKVLAAHHKKGGGE